MLRITVLGKSPSWQDAGGACSGYLVEEAEHVLLIDCGNGVFAKLRRYRDYVDVDAVVISHLHADHFLDLVPYAYALTYAPRQQPVPVDRWPGTERRRGRACSRPRGARDVFRRVVGRVGQRGPDRERVRRCASTRPTTSRGRPAARCASTRSPHFAADARGRGHATANGAGALHLRRRQPRRPTSSCASPRAPTC